MPIIPIIVLIVNGIVSCLWWVGIVVLMNFFNYFYVSNQLGETYSIEIGTLPFIVTGLIFLVATVISFFSLYYLLGKAYAKSQLINSALKEVREKLENRNQEIESANEELRLLVTNLENINAKKSERLNDKDERLKEYAFINSHLLRAPLAKILAISDLISDGYKIDQKLNDALIMSSNELDQIIGEINRVVQDDDKASV